MTIGLTAIWIYLTLNSQQTLGLCILRVHCFFFHYFNVRNKSLLWTRCNERGCWVNLNNLNITWRRSRTADFKQCFFPRSVQSIACSSHLSRDVIRRITLTKCSSLHALIHRRLYQSDPPPRQIHFCRPALDLRRDHLSSRLFSMIKSPHRLIGRLWQNFVPCK